MKDILFIVPLYYTSHFIERFRQYLIESKTNYSYDVYLCCSNPLITEESKELAKKYGYIFEERGNYGGGEGSLWFLQKKSQINLNSYRYIWYFEESCEPVKKDWVERLVGDMDKGLNLVGWDWHFNGRKRLHQIKHQFKDKNGNIMVAFENTKETGNDPEGNSFEKTWDTACYRDETFIVRAKDFIQFEYPDASDPFWETRNGTRGYGIRAERFWWDMADQKIHYFKYHSPNIQWYILNKYHNFPSPYNIYYSYFREIPMSNRKSNHYIPKPIFLRYTINTLKTLIPFLARNVYTFIRIVKYKNN